MQAPWATAQGYTATEKEICKKMKKVLDKRKKLW